MSIDGEHELSITHLEDFEHPVVGSREQQRAVVVERDSLDWCRVGLDHVRVALHGVVPYPHCLICRARNNLSPIGGHNHAVDWPFVSNEAERPHLGLEVPDHDSAVERAADGLLEVGVERHRSDAVFVALERSLKGGVADSDARGRSALCIALHFSCF